MKFFADLLIQGRQLKKAVFEKLTLATVAAAMTDEAQEAYVSDDGYGRRYYRDANGNLRKYITDADSVVPSAGASFAQVIKTATQSIPVTTPTAVLWESETADTDTYHSNLTLISRMTLVAAQVANTPYKLFGHLRVSGISGANVDIFVRKNGSTRLGTIIPGADDNTTGDAQDTYVWPFSGFDPAPAINDYYEVVFTKLTGAGNAQIEIADSDFIIERAAGPGATGATGATGPSGSALSLTYIASENLTIGQPLNIWNDAGTLKLRKASNVGLLQIDQLFPAKFCHGFATATVTAGNVATIQTGGVFANPVIDVGGPVAVGEEYFLGVNNITQNIAPKSGKVYAPIGIGISTTEILIRIADIRYGYNRVFHDSEMAGMYDTYSFGKRPDSGAELFTDAAGAITFFATSDGLTKSGSNTFLVDLTTGFAERDITAGGNTILINGTSGVNGWCSGFDVYPATGQMIWYFSRANGVGAVVPLGVARVRVWFSSYSESYLNGAINTL